MSGYPIAFRCFLLILVCAPYSLLAEQGTARLSDGLLNSERIAQRFGNYGIEVGSQNRDHRVSNLYSEEKGTRTTRTLAVVDFLEPVSPSIAALHESVLSGASLGATFKSNGWRVSKINFNIEKLVVADHSGKVQGWMRLEGEHELALHTYLVRLSKDGPQEGKKGQSIDYAVIAELHHPDYLDLEAVKAIHGETTDLSKSGQTLTNTARSALLEFITR